MTTKTILITCAFFFTLSTTLVIRWRILNREGFRVKIGEDLLFIFLSAIFPPYFIYTELQELYYRNRPRPLPKKLRKNHRKDMVIYNGQIMPLSQYNFLNNMDYTLLEVYGKKYNDSITEDEWWDIYEHEKIKTIDDLLDYNLRQWELEEKKKAEEKFKEIAQALYTDINNKKGPIRVGLDNIDEFLYKFKYDYSVCESIKKHPEQANWIDEVCCTCHNKVIKMYLDDSTYDEQGAIHKLGWLKMCPMCGKRLTFETITTRRGDELKIPFDLVDDRTGLLDIILSDFDGR